MEDIKKLVDELAKEDDKAVQILQEINKLLLTEYVIKIGNVIIQPLLVETYYYNKDKFDDENTHGFKDEKCAKMQSNRFNQFYFHRIGYGGVDICLSKGNYCLSFLIKNSIVSGIGFCSQTKLYDFMKKELTNQMKISFEELENQKDILYKSHHNYEIINTVRKGLTKESYKKELLASLPIEEIKNFHFTLEKGHSRTELIKEYLQSEAHKSIPTKSIPELEELRKNHMSVKEFNKLFGDNK